MAVVLMASFLRVGNGQFVWMPYRCIGYAEIYIYHVVMYVSQCKIHFTSKVDPEICVHYSNLFFQYLVIDALRARTFIL